MIKSNDDLHKAYLMIQKRFRSSNKKASNLKKIGFRNKWNYVITEENQVGFAFNFTADHAVYGQVDDMEQFIQLQPFVGKSLFEFVEYLLSKQGIQMRSVCLASLNALSQSLIDDNQNNCNSVPQTESFDFVQPEDVVTVIGYSGIINKIYGRCKELHICDMRPKYLLNTLTIGERIEYGPEKINFHPAAENEEILAKSDVVLMTGCTLVNGTFQELINFSQKARVIGMYGLSAGMIPDYLMNCGINYISSSRVLRSSKLEYQLANSFDLSESFKLYTKPYTVRKF